ncbi:MFS transporter [Citricoccus nitrophenolicus]|uniref:CP family cyanate transporter-like MFS transporter n=1 Tax=Citricoccus muralis TaxID=169134 RepID=A0A3D9LAR2_9MICC|nr:MFS transporter [Citricoccus muralis]REE03448.1 CP family cyanate transporter-like MFS transporter [Citricoccus muralis]
MGVTTRRPPVASPILPWIIVGIVILALNLRAPIIAPTAVLGDIQAETGLDAVGAGLLTGLPILLFALATPLATRTIRRWGSEATVFACLAGVLAGTLLRSAGPAWMVLAGTAVIGLSLTLGNIVVPVIIRREVPWDRVSLATGLYSAGMNVGSMATLLGTGPLAAAVGWRWALALWGVLAVVGMTYWLALARRRLREAPDGQLSSSETVPASEQKVPTARRAGGRQAPQFRRVMWLLVIAFSGQSAGYFTTTTWLPSILADSQGLDTAGSGATASLFQVAAIVGALGVPLLAARTRPWVPMAVVAVLWLSLPLGLLLAPDAYVLWSLTGGVAQGGGFTAIFSIIARMAGNDSEAASGSAFVQTGGYLAATIAPPFAGWLHTATDGWTAPVLLVLAATLAFTTAGLLAARSSARPPGARQAGADPA